MYFPEAQELEEFKKHQDNLLPYTSRYIGEKNLEIGCGNGITSLIHKRELGISPTLCDVVDIQHPLAQSLPFELIKGEELPFDDGEFESSYIQYVLHHLSTREEVVSLLKEAFRVSKRVIIVEEIQGEKTELERAKRFDEEINSKIYPNEQMSVYHYYTVKEIESFFDQLGHNTIFHKTVSEGDERTGFLETHIFVGE